MAKGTDRAKLRGKGITRYHVFLASPGDVREHRDFVRGFFADYNIQHGAAKGLEFQIVDWENWSTLGVGNVQKRITRQLLDKHRESLALVVGILGQRFGTPTETHESGTEEEFEWALECWKEDGHPEIKWFFLDPEELTVPVKRKEREEYLAQWDKVEAFQERLNKGDKKAGDPEFYCGTFQDLDSFEECLRRDLNLWLGDAERPWNAPAALPARKSGTRTKRTTKKASKAAQRAEVGSELLGGYLNRLREDTGKIQLIGLGQDLQVELDILEAYVPLKTSASRALVAGEREMFERAEEDEAIDVNGIFKRAADFGLRGAVLLGDPGAGKTTAARQLVFGLASGRVTADSLGLPPGVAPLLLRFRNLETADAESGFRVFLEREVTPSLDDSATRRKRRRSEILKRPSLLWVLDGLDEVVDEALRRKAGDWVAKLLVERPQDHFLVTSRFQGYRGKAELGARFVEFHVQPLEAEQSREFVGQYYREVCCKLYGRGAKAQREAKELIESLTGMLDGPAFRIGRISELPANPLLLTILCVVHHQDRNLPRRRADLYARCLRVLLEHWRLEVWKKQGAKPFDAPSAERVLAELAWEMHQEQGRIAMAVEELATTAEATLVKIPEDAGLGRDGAKFLERMRDRCGVMAMVGEGKSGFLHLSFQEYLAGVHAESRSLAGELAGHFGETWWREPTLLAMAVARPEFTEAFFEEVLDGAAWKEHADLLGQCLDEARNPETGPFAKRLRSAKFGKKNLVRLLRLLAGRELPELAEAAAVVVARESGEARSLAEQMARRGKEAKRPAKGRAEKQEAGTVEVDARTGVELVWIPPGTFRMGSNRIDDEEKPVHEVTLSEGFWLGRYAVTNRDYARFLEDAEHPAPEYWSQREYNAEQQPVVGVSWDDAQAYCEWAGGRLPTEAEWEYACRAKSTTEFSFGDEEEKLGEFGWYDDNSDRELHPVGQKKPNPWGLYDMHGNVWEWCQDGQREYTGAPVADPVGPLQQGAERVVRGGGWVSWAGSCRSAFRLWFRRVSRRQDLGFRLAAGQPSSSPARDG